MTGKEYTLESVRDLCSEGSLVSGSDRNIIRHVCFDTRQLFKPSEAVFIALRGENRDGHHFIRQAFERGVRNFILEDEYFLPEKSNGLIVDNSLLLLQNWAGKHRQTFVLPVIGITGSNGKTIVKEWLSTLLNPHMEVYKSPRSYNSQLGVALSLLEISSAHELAIIEAGISKIDEMEVLERMIQPDFGIMTHFGDAHDEGFGSRREKLAEKLKLFRNCSKVWIHENECSVYESPEASGIPFELCGNQNWLSNLVYPGEDAASVENLHIAATVAGNFGADEAELISASKKLRPVSMRTELISDNPEITIINDSYNADESSIYNAFSILQKEKSQPYKKIILTDLQHQGSRQADIQKNILKKAEESFGDENLYLIGPVFSDMQEEFPGMHFYPDTASFITDFDYSSFVNSVVLLKGARQFSLESLIPFLSRQVHATTLQIDLNRLTSNFRILKSMVPAGTKIMSMVKAFGYGSGTWEIAGRLEAEGTDYLAVAYISEGINLRTKGIAAPIMVMNPDPGGFEQLYHYGLEPEIYSHELLKHYSRTGKNLNLPGKIHLKVDTGMHRLGFRLSEIESLNETLKECGNVTVRSIFSHLASADDPSSDILTRQQINLFEKFIHSIEILQEEIPLKHLLNTAGILRYPEQAYDMVRAGIGLYGIDPIPGGNHGLKEIGSMRTVISQVREYPKGTPVGYGFSQTTEKLSRIATIPVGYADGIPRSLGNGRISVLASGNRVPTFGKICMDMTMLDVTGFPGINSGDEVVIFGEQNGSFLSVQEIADAAGTIPYEILAGISGRVRRIYHKE